MKKAVAAAMKALAGVWLVGNAAAWLLWAGWPLLERPIMEYERRMRYSVYISAHEDALLEAVRQAEAGETAQIGSFDFVYQQDGTTRFGVFDTATEVYGICYSPQDEPPVTDGDDRIRICRLKKNWFYFAAHF